MASTTIKYRYGRSLHGEIVDIFALDKENRTEFGEIVCLSCERTLIPALGDIVAHHFRHKHVDVDEQVCAPETYLHMAAKLALHDKLARCISTGEPFFLTRPGRSKCPKFGPNSLFACDHRGEDVKEDIARRFTRVSMERSIHGFVGDLVLESEETGDILLIEMAVTHRCSPEKLASGLPILEISVQDEGDIEQILAGVAVKRPREEEASSLSALNGMASEHNLWDRPFYRRETCCGHGEKYHLHMLASGDRYYHYAMSLSRLATAILSDEPLLYTVSKNALKDGLFIRAAAEKLGRPVRNCWFCSSFDDDAARCRLVPVDSPFSLNVDGQAARFCGDFDDTSP